MIKSPLAGACLLALAILMSPATAQETSGIHEVNVPAHSLSWAPVAGSDYWVATWDMGSESYYAVSRDAGRTTLTTRHAEKEIGLRYFRFDPLRETPLIPEELTAVSDARLMILQSTTQILEPYQESLAALGVEVLHRLPKQSLIVRMDGASKARVEALPWVRWVGPCHPAYKLDRQQLLELATGNLPTREYNVQVTRKGLKEKLTVGSFVRDIGGQVHEYTSPHGYLFRATLDRDQLLAVIARDDVLFADVWSPEEPDMDKARILGGADYVETVGGYTGAGVRGQVRDTGLDFSHPDWQFAPIPHNGTSGSVDHGSCVYGIVFGSGGGNAAARGLLPDGQGFFHSSGTTSDRYIETGQLLLPPIRAVFETNSTGSNRTTEYTTISADMDNILFDHDVVVLQSQSNAGSTAEPRDSRPQAWAKNIVAVGGIRHYDTLTTTDDAWNGAGSIGPAADGRLKPDVSMFYDATLCAEATGAAGYTSGNYYSNFGGTSGATPICAGYMGLIHQMWADGIFGNALVAGDVFDNKPHATLAKALMINSASPYAFSGIGADLARYKQGWGRPDLQRLYDRRLNVYFVNETDLLGNLQSTTHVLTVLPGETEFHATMVYSDPAGNPGAAMHRINDLTLKVTDPSGTIYWGNNGLAAGNVSTPGGSANLVDTVENVIVLNPAAGTWLVEILAADVSQDAVPATTAIDADYALLVSGVQAPPPPTPDTGQANTADASMSVFGARNINFQSASLGTNGPFFIDLVAGESLAFSFDGPANRPFALLQGPLNRNNDIIPNVGSLDIGMMGNISVYSDLAILLDGVFPVTFLDQLAKVGPSGSQTLSFPVPNLPPGSLGTLQALFWDVPSVTLKLSAATEINIQ